MSLERFTRGSALRTALLFVVAAYAGALLAFAGAAGVVLRESPSRHAGGNVNRALLDLLDVGSWAVAAVAVLLVLLLDRAEPLSKVQKGMALRLLAVVAAAAFASHDVVTPQMLAIRDRLATTIDLLAPGDPARRDWGRLHAFSSTILLVRIVAASALFVLLARKPKRTIAVAAPASPAGPAETPGA